MNFEQLWAPWRIAYITGEKAIANPQAPAIKSTLTWHSAADQNCFLCRAVAESASEPQLQREIDRRNLLVFRSPIATVVLNRYPYNNGHLLVAPLRHSPELSTLSEAEHLELMRLLTRATEALKQLMNPEGFNVGLNLGRVAGAGLPGHIHWHIVPRWNGDTNFMPVLAGVNVIPQSLDAVWELLHEALHSPQG